MVLFFGSPTDKIFAVQCNSQLSEADLSKLIWLFDEPLFTDEAPIPGVFIGPRAAMITPWSSNAVDICCNMGLEGILRIETYHPAKTDETFDPMLFQKYQGLDQGLFEISIVPEPIREIQDIGAYNDEEGLALSEEEVRYLDQLSDRLGRLLTDSEVFGFSQVNSEHCRHKIFNGEFVIDGKRKPNSLFQLIKKTSASNPNEIVSAYKDNVAFIKGPRVKQFAPVVADRPAKYVKSDFESVISLKAETHNFPTTVEPFNGAATGSGGEIRDRMAGGQGSIPLAGTAVYMTAYPRIGKNRPWEKGMPERRWLYQSPLDILIKASNGASDFGNKFGQPLIAGSVLTFEHTESGRKLGFDKVIMLAGGVGYGKADQAQKKVPVKGDCVIVMGGDNYRIGMGGAAVSSADTGAFSAGIELNAVQRSNPEMQKRVSNTVRGLIENSTNPIVSIHDHGAGGHLNCLSELVEETGGEIDMDKLPIGDPTLSAKEIIGNESQERMGLVIAPKDLEVLQRTAARERAPLYEVGVVTGDHRFTFFSNSKDERPMDLMLSDMFGSSPKTVLQDQTSPHEFDQLSVGDSSFETLLNQVLQLEAVACKDWLTNKVDRCVGGRVAKQQCVGPLQLPLNNVAVMAMDFDSSWGVATSIGHAPISGLIDAAAGARNSIAEALTNLIWAPLKDGLKSVSLSANWMWPCRNTGEDARLYEAVKSVSDFCLSLGINVPTGKDSLSMKQKYPDGEVIAPGTVIISSVAQCSDITNVIEPVLHPSGGPLYYLNLSGDTHKLGGSSLAQIVNQIGDEAPDVLNTKELNRSFDAIQNLIKEGRILAGHDVAGGGLITTLLEMCFAANDLGAEINLSAIGQADSFKLLFAENAGIVFQARSESIEEVLQTKNIPFHRIGTANTTGQLEIINHSDRFSFDVAEKRDIWYKTSYLLDCHQTPPSLAKTRYDHYQDQPLQFIYPEKFSGKIPATPGDKKITAAIIRDQGSNSERELAHALFLAGFEVRDVHMTDLIEGRETLEDVRFLGAVGGFSNSDVLGSAKGWAGSFLYNEKANQALKRFFDRSDVLSIGICNGCQLFMELDLINPTHPQKGKMGFNDSHKHESAFTSVQIPENNSVMLSTLAGTRLGVWVSHGEGKFQLPLPESEYNIVGKYGYAQYPANPNGSDYNTAMLASHDGRHLVTMPHIERSIFTWNWAYYDQQRSDMVSPWIEAFMNARMWLTDH